MASARQRRADPDNGLDRDLDRDLDRTELFDARRAPLGDPRMSPVGETTAPWSARSSRARQRTLRPLGPGDIWPEMARQPPTLRHPSGARTNNRPSKTDDG